MEHKNKLKPVRCDNCKHFDEDVNYKGEGVCNKDGEYTRKHGLAVNGEAERR